MIKRQDGVVLNVQNGFMLAPVRALRGMGRRVEATAGPFAGCRVSVGNPESGRIGSSVGCTNGQTADC